MKYALCNELYGTLDVHRVIDRASELGYDGLELAPFTLADDLLSYPAGRQRELAEHARDRGVEIMGYHWLLRAPEGLHLLPQDAKVRQATLDLLRKLIELGANTGGRILTLGSPKQRSFPEGDDLASASERVRELLSALTPELEEAGLLLSFEPLEYEYTNLLTSTAEARALADSMGSPAYGITLDTHFLRWEREQRGVGLKEALSIAGGRLAHIHVQDDNRRAPGMGGDDFGPLVSALGSIGWDGWMSMETFVSEDPGEAEEIAARGIEFMRRHFG